MDWNNGNSLIPGFRSVPMSGVIYVTTEANKRGFRNQSKDWANLGQGAPEVRNEDMTIPAPARTGEYGSVAGVRELREAVANLYNELFRKGKRSQYTWENVSIANGGRLALTRVATTLGNIHVGHFIPDYTAYEELLTVFRAFTPIPIPLSSENCWAFSADDLRDRIRTLGLGAFLISNPGNPTGRVTRGEDLRQWVEVAREEKCSAIFDEFYAHYLYDVPKAGEPNIFSAAQYVEDVETDPVVIIDGLTKGWRLPGWRLSWTLAPTPVIEAIASAGSFLDGGATHPLSRAAIPLLEPSRVRKDVIELQELFGRKRAYTIERLEKMGISVPCPPAGAFYVLADLSKLPAPLNDGMEFFKAGLDEKVITVPGEFFDVNPGKRRPRSAYKHFARVGFGPSMEELTRGLDALERVVAKINPQARSSGVGSESAQR
jgi:aspartate/methionine/tyrosine aminotransferase